MRTVRDTRLIPVRVVIEDKHVCNALVQLLIDEDGEMDRKLIVQEGVDLSWVDPENIEVRIIKPLDTFAYLGAVSPDAIGRDE